MSPSGSSERETGDPEFAEAIDRFVARVHEVQPRICEAPADQRDALAAEIGSMLQEAASEVESAATAWADAARTDADELSRRNSSLEAERSHYRSLFEGAPLAYVRTDGRAAIVEASGVAGEMLFGGTQPFLPKPFLTFIDRGSHLAFLNLVRAARETAATVQGEVLLSPFRRDPIPALVSATAVRDAPAGAATGFRFLLADITDIDCWRTEMRARVAELEETKSANEAFLLAVAHDVRAPVSAIAGLAAASRAMTPDALPPPVASVLDSIAGHAAALQRMGSDLLDFTRVRRGLARPDRRFVDVADLVEDVVKHAALERRVVEVTTVPLVARIDRGLIASLLQKLVDNAARHTPEGSSVWMTLEDHPETGSFLIVVEDDGPGVDAASRDRVFELFERGESSARSVGAGAGLFLVRKFAELHGGTARLVERPGGGARFEVSIPTGDEASTSN